MPKPWIRCWFVASLVFPALADAQLGQPWNNDRWMRDQAIYRRQTEIEKNLENVGQASAAAPEDAPAVEAPVEELDSEDALETGDEPEELADDEAEDESDEAVETDETNETDEAVEAADSDAEEDSAELPAEEGDEDSADADSQDLPESDE